MAEGFVLGGLRLAGPPTRRIQEGCPEPCDGGAIHPASLQVGHVALDFHLNVIVRDVLSRGYREVGVRVQGHLMPPLELATNHFSLGEAAMCVGILTIRGDAVRVEQCVVVRPSRLLHHHANKESPAHVWYLLGQQRIGLMQRVVDRQRDKLNRRGRSCPVGAELWVDGSTQRHRDRCPPCEQRCHPPVLITHCARRAHYGSGLPLAPLPRFCVVRT
mmetsp:Transcript_4058/g.10223  ORF Transcript_4058/g.10223 Transcript_4058/m.10223 type:complete len:217 (+) Transcript_4058:651-1301(+)